MCAFTSAESFYTGIYRDKTMADKFMYIPNVNIQINPSVDKN